MEDNRIDESLLTDDFTPLLTALRQQDEQESKEDNEAG